MLRSITSVTSVDDLAQLSANSEDDQNQLSYLTKDDLKALGAMPLLNRGRLSVQPVNEGAWTAIDKLAEKGGWDEQIKPKPKKGVSRPGKSAEPAKPKKSTKRKTEEAEEAESEFSEKPNVDIGPATKAPRRSQRRKT
ncbi:hypothetical protein BN14_01588 [Rhizoctonia solani AG-1 IB]|nr:hypothetical protein BN14_01588 [Rhizoctonia solani AG-1 IB]